MPLLYEAQQRLTDYPYILEIHKTSFREWMLNYSVKEFLAGGRIHMEPEKFDSPKWINSLYYQVHPVSRKMIETRLLTGYVYLQDGTDGTMKLIFS